MGSRKYAGGAAHVLLHDAHGALGLDVEPAGVERHALADESNLGILGVAPGKIDEPRGPIGGAPDRMDQREVLFDEVVAHDRAHRRAVQRRQRPRRLLQLRRAEVVRRRVDEVAREGDALGDAREVGAVEAVRDFEPDLLGLSLAVARKAIASERDGERREPRIMGRVGETIGPGRQQVGEPAGEEQVLLAVLVFEAEQYAAETVARARQQ